MSKLVITKQQLINVIVAWGSGSTSTEQLQHWMLDNFEPDEADIGSGESESVVEAMHIVMNEYELAKESKCLVEQYQLAINFINCDETNFMQRKSDFLRQAFCD
ncbi:hypothetical protein CW748_13770 [Alteromonadales bacterium alter-6D02]|nr:hypothetical protein CW748_13770 [Alteromonadales bacterium alter-6D02]